MPPKKHKSRDGNSELPHLVAKFPFRVGDEVEMKSFESGYRGAWFRVQIKKIRLDRKGNIWSTMVYKDYTDESEEEIRVFEKDPASEERILMVRPLPPPSVKESKFNKSVHTKLCVVYRDDWEVGDLVDWWYHHCWWAAKVISVVGDGRFQLVCPAPPGGEGGVYLANSRDLRPSLKWSNATQWTAPPSKEIGKIPCARIVWLLDSNEAAEFSAPNQDHVPQKRGRPKMMRVLDRKATALVAPLNPDKEFGNCRRPRVVQLTRPPVYNQRATELAAPNRDTKVPQKRGRPKKVDGQDEAATKRRRPIVIKIIHPRQDPGHEKVDHMLRKSSVDETRLEAKEDGKFGRCTDVKNPEDEMIHRAKQDFMTTGRRPGDERERWVKKENLETQKQPDRGDRPCTEHRTSLIAKQMHEEKRHGIKQKRSVIRLPDRFHMIRENRVSNGHCDEAKRRKVEHIAIVSEPDVGGEEDRQQTVQDEGGNKQHKGPIGHKDDEGFGNHVKDGLMMEQSKARKKQMKFEENKSAVKTMLISRIGDVVVEHMLDLVPREQITLPCLEEGKETGADQVPGAKHFSGQHSKDEKQNGELKAQLFSSNFSSNPVNGEVKIPEEDVSDGEACKEAVDLKVLKVLNAYEEAFTDTICLEVKNTCLSHDLSAKEYKDALTSDDCPLGQISVVASKDLSVVKASEEAIIKDGHQEGSARRNSSVAQDPSPANRKLAKSGECAVYCNQKNLMKGKVPQVRSTSKGISSPDTNSNTLQGRHLKKSAAVSDIIPRHELVIGTETSSLGTISVGGSPDSFSGRMADVSIEGAIKDTASSHDDASVVDAEESRSSLEESSQNNQSRKSANNGLNTTGDKGLQAEKSDKDEFSLVQKRRTTKPVMKHKVSLSRKLIDQARREVSAKRRRSCRSTPRG